MKQFWNAFLGLIALTGCFAATAAQAQQTAAPKIAVYNFKDPQGSGQAAALKDMITTAIINSGKFTVISRDFESAEAEAALRSAGKTTRGRAGPKPKAESFDYSIEGSITSVQAGTQVNNTGSTASKALLGIDLGGCAKQVVSISIDVVIKNIATQETPYAAPLTRRVETKCKQSGEQVDVPFLMRSIANELARDFSLKIYPITVIAVQPDGGMVFDYGSSVLPAGTFLNVYGPGQEIARNGKLLTVDGPLLGRVQITNSNAETARGVFEGAPLGQIEVGATAAIDANQQPVKKSKGRR
jgi:TolB-like protein